MSSMSSSAGAFSPNHQAPNTRTRENPFFDGLLRADDDDQVVPFNSQGRRPTNSSKKIIVSVSDMPEQEEDFMDLPLPLPLQNSLHVPAFNYESFEHSASKRWLKVSNEELIHSFLSPARSISIEKTYTVTRSKETLSSVLLPLSAASYYNGISPQMEIVESSESINKLNAYLKARKDDVNAGVPGKFLHAVIGSDDADVGTVASTIMYSFYLDVTLKSEQLCTVPIINMNRANLGSHVELKWLLDSCQIDQSSLIFADEIDLSYYDLFGSLKLVLMKSSKLPPKQEKLKHDVVEIFHCRKGETIYPWVKTLTTGEESSCCTDIADKFATYSPEILACKSFSRVLLAGILLDSGNLRDPHCTSKDKYMASLLINGAGRYGCTGLYQLLRYKMHDLSSLQVVDILRRDFNKWGSSESRTWSQIGMSCIGISIEQLLAHTENLAQEITYFQSSETLRALIIVSGYYNEGKNFKREVLVSTESVKLLESLLFFFDFNASRLPLKPLHVPGLKNEMKAFEIDKITSRKTIEHLIEEFIGTSKA